jgi:hypothetical protein
MIFTFRSNASGDVIMLENNGRQILGLLGKNLHDATGVITVEEMPGAINTLKAAMQDDKTARRESPDDEDEIEVRDHVFLYQRAFPILKMLERSLKEDEPVTWTT